MFSSVSPRLFVSKSENKKLLFLLLLLLQVQRSLENVISISFLAVHPSKKKKKKKAASNQKPLVEES